MTEDDLIDMLSEAISDSMDMDWRSSDGARSILARLKDEGLMIAPIPDVRETAWLVEQPEGPNNHARWWNPNPNMGWMIDVNKGIRFCRKQDAEDHISNMRLSGSIATEHVWINGAAQP